MADPPADESVNFSARRSSRGHYAALAAGLMVLLFIGRSELPPLEDTTEVLARGLSTGVSFTLCHTSGCSLILAEESSMVTSVP